MSETAPSLRNNFARTLLGNAIFAGSLWGILIVLTRLGSPADVGRYALASAVATPLMLLAGLQLRTVLIADTDEAHPFGEYLGVALSVLPAALVALTVIAAVGYDGAQFVAIVIFGVARLVEATSDVFLGLAQKHERLDLVAGSLAVKGLCGLVLFTAFFVTTGQLTWALLGLPLGWACALFGFDIPRCRHLLGSIKALRPQWRAAAWRHIVWTSLPLGVAILLIQLRLTVPRTVLEHDHGEAQLGIFAALSYLVLVGNTIVMALSQAAIARLARARACSDAAGFANTVRKLVLVGAGLGMAGVLAAVLLGRPLLSIIYGSEYADHQALFVWIMTAGGVLYVGSILGAPATAMRAFRSQLLIHSVNSVLLIVSGLMLIPPYGMLGAAWTTLIGAVWVTGAYSAVVALGIARMRHTDVPRGVSS